VSTPHDSVVARPTFTRTLQIEHFPYELPEGHHGAALPSTVNEKGAVVTDVVHPAFKAAKAAAMAAVAAEEAGLSFVGGDFGTEYGNDVMGNLPPPGSRQQQQNRIVEIDVPRGAGGGKNGMSGFNPPSLGGAGGGGGMGSPGTASAVSRGLTAGGFSRGDNSMTSDSRRSAGGNSASQATLLGAPSVLLVRLRGDVFPVETTKNILERNAELNILQDYFVPQAREFIPPAGKKFFDAYFIEEQKKLHSKAKVNLSFIKGRDEELRDITQLVADDLFKVLLAAVDVRETCRATVSGENIFAVDVPGTSHGSLFKPSVQALQEQSLPSRVVADNQVYGVYFPELKPSVSLLRRLIVELKCLGVVQSPTNASVLAGVVVPGQSGLDLPVNSKQHAVPAQWTTVPEAEMLMADAEECFFFMRNLPSVVDALFPQWWCAKNPESKDALESFVER
jgi:hypothetical protein